jgi:serine/threonine-protein kinase HipA
LPVEDFAQLSGASRETKYDSSIERVIAVIDAFCSFPVVERVRLLRRLVCCFLTGNEDMHLKNWSLVTREGRVELAPAYDLLNTTIVLGGEVEESALPLNGRRRNLRASTFWRYLASERLELPARVIDEVRSDVTAAVRTWPARIAGSFLSPETQERYLAVVRERVARLELAA